MAKYRRNFADDDAEIARLEAEARGEVPLEEEPADTETTGDPEEDSFKKRYGDLRRHMQTKEAEFNQKITELTARLNEASKDDVKLPASEAEMQEFMDTYPKVGNVVQSMITKGVNEALEKLDGRLKKVDELEAKTAQEKAFQELDKLHPDFFPEIVKSQEFHDWVKEQKTLGYDWVYEAIYEQSTNAKLAADAISKFKASRTTSDEKKKSKANPKDAARSTKVGNASTAPKDEGKGKLYDFSESMVDKMSNREYEANEEAINKAIADGRFNWDISGTR